MRTSQHALMPVCQLVKCGIDNFNRFVGKLFNMKQKPRSIFQVMGWVILIALLMLSFFLLPMVMIMMHDGIPKDRLALWLPLYVLVVAFPVMAAYFYWSVLRKYVSALTFWLIVSAATLGLVLFHRMTFEERISSNHREVVTFFVGAFIGGTLGGMLVFGLVNRFIPRWLSIAQATPREANESGRPKKQIGLKSIFIWTTGIAIIAAAFTNPAKLLLLENDSLRVFLYQLFTFIGYAVFCTFLFLPVQAWLSNVTPRWLGKISLLIFCIILPPSILWVCSAITIAAFAGEEMIVTLTFSAMLFYLGVYAILWNQACRWTGIVTEKKEPEQARRLGLFGRSFSLLRSGGKVLILASTVAFMLLSFIWGAWHLIGGQAQDVGLINKKIHTLLGSENHDRDWVDAVNDHISKGITAENNLAVKVIKTCNPYAVWEREAVSLGTSKYSLVINDSDPGKHREIERLGLTLEQLAEYPPLEVGQWLAEREFDFQKQLEEDFPIFGKRLQSYSDSVDSMDLDNPVVAKRLKSLSDFIDLPPKVALPEEVELTRDERLAEYFIGNGVSVEDLVVAPWSKEDCALGAEFVESHRAKTEQLIELSKETSFYVPAVRRAEGPILHFEVFSRIVSEPGLLLASTGFFDLGSGETENAVLISEALWRFAKLAPFRNHHMNRPALRHARNLSQAIAFSGAATESQMRRILKCSIDCNVSDDSLLRAQKLKRVFLLGQVYDRMTAPTPHTTYKADYALSLFLYQKFPWAVNWEVYLDRTEQLIDQFDEIDRAIWAGELAPKQFYAGLGKFATKTLPNGVPVWLHDFNSFPAQQFSVFVHGPKSKGKMIAESTAVDTMSRHSTNVFSSQLYGRISAMEKIAIGLEVYKTMRSAYPASLPDLVPEILPAIPVDPVTLGDFVYAPSKTDFKLYALGRDGVDDGGDEELDIIFRRPAKDLCEGLIRDK